MPEQLGRAICLDCALIDVTASGPAGQGQYVQDVAVDMMLDQGAATSDFYIVRMGADCQDAPLLPLAVGVDALREHQGLLHKLGRRFGLEQQGIDAAFHSLAHEMRALVGGHHHRGEPAMVVLQMFQQGEATGEHGIDGYKIVDPALYHMCCGLGVSGIVQLGRPAGVELSPQRERVGVVAVHQQDVQRFAGLLLHDVQPRLILFCFVHLRHTRKGHQLKRRPTRARVSALTELWPTAS